MSPTLGQIEQMIDCLAGCMDREKQALYDLSVEDGRYVRAKDELRHATDDRRTAEASLATMTHERAAATLAEYSSDGPDER